MSFAEVEIRVFARQNQDYPLEIKIKGEAQEWHGKLGGDFLPWLDSADPDLDGQRLFESLLEDDSLKSAWAQVRGRHPQRRLRLRIDPSAPELSAIPWEILKDNTPGYPVQALAADETTPFSRFVANSLQNGHAHSDRPIKFVLAIANPENLEDYGLDPISVDAERQIIQEALADLNHGHVQFEVLDEPLTLTRLKNALRAGTQILHIVAHGKFEDQSVLYLADEQNQVALVDEEMIATIVGLHDQKPLLVFLASCQSATRDSGDAYKGLAPRLINSGVPAVLAMQETVPMRTASAFARVFYESLFQHGEVDLASNQARAQLIAQKLPGKQIPVLYSRLTDNRLLDVSQFRPMPRLPNEPNMIFIPGGRFCMGPANSIPPASWLEHWIDLPAYKIGKYPVTNREYAQFVETNPDHWPQIPGWHKSYKPNHPVTGISWHSAQAYCGWVSDESGRTYRLPSEAEWEKAARGCEDARPYPWGAEWLAGLCNCQANGTTPVGTFPNGASPYGCLDMAGNVWEWTNTLWGYECSQAAGYHYPYQVDERERLEAPLRSCRILRGGAVGGSAETVGCSVRNRTPAEEFSHRIGFRVAQQV